MTILHKDIRPIFGDPAAGGHVLHYYTFNDVSAMNSGVDALLGPVSYTPLDIGRVGRVGSSAPYVFYVLANDTGPIWRPLGGGNAGYSGPLDATQTGTTELHIGSVYLSTGQTITASTSALIGTQAGGTANLRIRRFTGGTLMLTLSATGVGLSVATLGAPVPISADDYYDFFLYGDAGPTVSVSKSVRLVVE